MDNKQDVIVRIEEKYTSMSKSHKAIAGFIKEHYDQAVFMTAAKLGEELSVSESTVVRFAGGLGKKQAEQCAEDGRQIRQPQPVGNSCLRAGGGH